MHEIQLLYTNTSNTVEWETLKFEYISDNLKLILFFEQIDACSQDGELTIDLSNDLSLVGRLDLKQEKP